MKLFVLLPRFPFPLDKGDKLRAYFQLRELSKRHEITLCALSHEDVSEAARAAVAPLCHRVEVVRLSAIEAAEGVARAGLGDEPFQVGYFYSERAHRQVERVVSECRPDAAFLQLLRTARYVRGLDLPVTLDFMDAFSWSTKRLAEDERGITGALRANEAKRLLRYETEVFDQVARGSIISAQDRARLATPRRDEIVVVPNGVDLEHFRPRRTTARFDMLFVGNMSYPPNVAAARALATEILPLVQRQIPQATLKITGARPSSSVCRLRSEHVAVAGWVDDMPACYASARVFVAPISLGAGMSNKVLQALAMGMATVSTPEVSAAIEGSEEVLAISPTTEGFAERVVDLLQNPAKASQLGEAGRSFAETRLRWDRATEALDGLLVRSR